MTVANLDARVEDRGGVPVIVADAAVSPLTAEQTRAAIDRVRR